MYRPPTDRIFVYIYPPTPLIPLIWQPPNSKKLNICNALHTINCIVPCSVYAQQLREASGMCVIPGTALGHDPWPQHGTSQSMMSGAHHVCISLAMRPREAEAAAGRMVCACCVVCCVLS